MQLVEKAPRPSAAPLPREPRDKLMQEYENVTENEREALGLRLVTAPFFRQTGILLFP
jgi:hypothetical protein